jgi:hypothetical protein
VRRHFVGTEEKFAAGAIDDKAPASLTTFQNGRNGAIADLRIQKDCLTGRIILAVRGLLEEPAQRAGLCIERCDAVGVEIVAGGRDRRRLEPDCRCR